MHKIGIMGGTFNPIHVGHILLAQWAMEENGLDQVWFIPTGCPYMKQDKDIISPGERFYMTSLALAGNDRMKCLDLEIKRQGDTYTYETLEELGRMYPQDRFYFIIGADCLFSIESWRRPERIFQACEVIAAVRGDSPREEMQKKIEELKNRYGAKILLLDFLNLEISSTQIRERMRDQKSIRYLVPDAVASYIKERGFYSHEDK
ncbi:MAG: nicotinate-nucleotide adenylyltransferase [Candidatus Gastranaerophilales bacterium]|nr:nicotinate-nucleotide adenylyltransferase [Candidatus Gastranaerophilales bacterium]